MRPLLYCWSCSLIDSSELTLRYFATKAAAAKVSSSNSLSLKMNCPSGKSLFNISPVQSLCADDFNCAIQPQGTLGTKYCIRLSFHPPDFSQQFEDLQWATQKICKGQCYHSSGAWVLLHRTRRRVRFLAQARHLPPVLWQQPASPRNPQNPPHPRQSLLATLLEPAAEPELYNLLRYLGFESTSAFLNSHALKSIV